MSSNEHLITRPKADIIRLKVDGASTVVNTLRDQHAGRGLTLVCPFPALEVDMPVSFNAGPNGEMLRGSIHRIGVEDDPETGVPRLRLSIRTAEPRATVISETPKALIDETSRATALPTEEMRAIEQAIAEQLAVVPEDGPRWRTGVPLFMDDAHPLEDRAAVGEADSVVLDDRSPDPAWVRCQEMPLPEEMLSRSRSRRRQQIVGAIGWVAFCAMMGVGLAILERAGFIDLERASALVTGMTHDKSTPTEATVTKVSASSSIAEAKVLELAPAPPVAAEIAAANATQAAPVAEPIPAAPAVGSDIQLASAQDSIQIVTEPTGSPTPTEAEAVATAETATPAVEDITIVLPTKWPVEYATAYRVRDPNGVVVDVPGGLVKREGFLEKISTNPVIRSVKAIQRETGARFIVFINGELPRYMTAPRKDGIALRMTFGSDSASDKVASLSD